MSHLFNEKIRKNGYRRWRKLRHEILERDGYRCYVCGRILGAWSFEIDHKIPLHKLPPDADPFDPDNLRAICSLDHSIKTARENRTRRPRSRDERVWDAMVDELMEKTG